MKKEKISLGRRSADKDAISVDLSELEEEEEDKPQDDHPVNKIQVEFAMKVRGTKGVTYAPACSGKPPSRLDLEMFPGAVTGQVLMEGLATLAFGGAFSPHGTGVLMTDDGQIYPDDLLFRGFIGRRVQVIKTTEGLLVKKN